ncbi:hypothetical protein M758_UG321200 [Ceratodon purpureus]|nr:hypothetical protein M758_UG321200 [Ceratodon purpureus]
MKLLKHIVSIPALPMVAASVRSLDGCATNASLNPSISTFHLALSAISVCLLAGLFWRIVTLLFERRGILFSFKHTSVKGGKEESSPEDKSGVAETRKLFYRRNRCSS